MPSSTEPPEVARLRAEAGPENPEACCALGQALLALDSQAYAAEALNWFALSAFAGHPGGHYQLALHYHGPGNDRRMALYHLEAAAFQDYQPAVELLNAWKVEGLAAFASDDEAIRLLEAAAARGSNPARYQLAVRIAQGRGIAEAPRRVARLYRQAAQEGHMAAMHGLGACYRDGYGVPRDVREAFAWFTAAAACDYPDAWYALGLIHRHHPQRPDLPASAECLARAAALGHAQATFALAAAYQNAEGVPRDASRMRTLMARAAELGHADAQYWLGNYYRFGEDGFECNFERAAFWYERASLQDHASAIYALGLLTLLGHGVERDLHKAWGLVERAAKLGMVDAMISLATMIDSGEGRMDDPHVALYWYRQAADRGNADAQFVAGQRLLEIPGETNSAKLYLEKAAAQGNRDAGQLLASIPGQVLSIQPPGPAESLGAAMGGDARAQYQLAFAHYMGMGVPRSLPLSYFWFSVLAKTMPRQAEQMLGLLSPQLSAEVRVKLDREAQDWTPGGPPPDVHT
ncbi:putative Beta-lactamase [Candidatus Sulfopaludibacter sp. SbA4]|nr:putative Beta-lactamase [Candidatus Sulfopaludibacter sp. SbA4]